MSDPNLDDYTRLAGHLEDEGQDRAATAIRELLAMVAELRKEVDDYYYAMIDRRDG